MSITSFQVTIHELCECEDITESMLVEAVEHEIVAPLAGQQRSEWVFDTTHVVWIRKAVHLRQDLDLDWVAIAMLIDLLREKERLEHENQTLAQRLQRFVDD